jgi:hypothetical protein
MPGIVNVKRRGIGGKNGVMPAKAYAGEKRVAKSGSS